MVWGGITSTGRTPLVVINGHLNAVRYRDEIILPYVIPFVQGQQCHIKLQQDNARPHVAWVVRDCLAQQNIDVLPWPAVSPDLAPIEHVWDEMQRRVRALPNQPVTLAALGQTLVQIWNGIPQLFFNNLARSMRRRCQTCIDAKGGHTPY